MIDTVIIIAITIPLMMLLYGVEYWSNPEVANSEGFFDFLINYILPALYAIAFWIYKAATPGKSVAGLKIVDAKSGKPISVKQSFIRYVGYFVSILPLMLGIIWVAFDKKKRAWHDLMAGTVVIRNIKHLEEVAFEES